MSKSTTSPLSDSARCFFGSVKGIFNSSKLGSTLVTASSSFGEKEWAICSPISPSTSSQSARTETSHKLRKKSFYQVDLGRKDVGSWPSSLYPTKKSSSQISLTHPMQSIQNVGSASPSTESWLQRHVPRSPFSTLISRSLTPLNSTVQQDNSQDLHSVSSWTHLLPLQTFELQQRSILIREKLLRDDTNREINLCGVHHHSLRPVLPSSQSFLRSRRQCTASELSDLVEEYAQFLSNSESSEGGQHPGSSTCSLVCHPVFKDQQVSEIDFDSEEYFLEKLNLLQSDIGHLDNSILRSKFFQQVLKINSIDPKTVLDRDLRVIREKVRDLIL